LKAALDLLYAYYLAAFSAAIYSSILDLLNTALDEASSASILDLLRTYYR
jgi:hypothetical protein